MGWDRVGGVTVSVVMGGGRAGGGGDASESGCDMMMAMLAMVDVMDDGDASESGRDG